MGQPLYSSHTVSQKYHFTLSFDSALCKLGAFYTGNYILPHSGIIFDPQATILTLELLNPKSKDFDTPTRINTVPSFKSFQSGIGVLSW